MLRPPAAQDQRLQWYFECLIAIRTAQSAIFLNRAKVIRRLDTRARPNLHSGPAARTCLIISTGLSGHHVGLLGGQDRLGRAFAAQMPLRLHAVLHPDLVHVCRFATFIALHISSIGLFKFFLKGCSQLAFTVT